MAQRPGVAACGLWSRELFIGQYSGQPGPEFQVFGRIARVKLYHRPLEAAEILAAAPGPAGVAGPEHTAIST